MLHFAHVNKCHIRSTYADACRPRRQAAVVQRLGIIQSNLNAACPKQAVFCW